MGWREASAWKMVKGSEGGLPRRRLGRTPYLLSVVAVGGWLGLIPEAEGLADRATRERSAIEGVQRAIELGINYFDTAPMYQNGEAERLLGIGLNALPAKVREHLFVSTKVGWHHERPHQYDADTVRWSLDISLRQLFTDHVDIVHVHDPATDAHMDQILGPEGAVEALEKLKEEGVVGAISLGVRIHRFLQRAIRSGRFDAIMTTYDYHLTRSTATPIIDEAYAAGMGVLNASPYNAGLLAGVDPEVAAAIRPPYSPQDLIQANEVWAWANERAVDLGALAMQFSLRNEKIAVTVAGPRTAEEVEANVRHALTPLPSGIWEDLAAFLATISPASPGGEGGTPIV